MTDLEKRVHFRVVRFMNESAGKLRMKSVPLASASVLYHKFFASHSLKDYDPYLIATTCIYLAGKVEEEHIKLRDVINSCYRTLHKSRSPLELGDTFWSLRESVANCELFVLRTLRFKVIFSHPHKYLLHNLKYLQDWFEPYRWESLPIGRTAWGLLRDCYHGNMCLQYKPQHLAVAVLYFSLMCHGVEVPYHKYADTPWWMVFSEDVTLDLIKTIISDLMALYELENTV